ncbi:hypothetical protein [Variovorax sp. 54]|uniref:hypothetical protein n=1 Tax=Variovorax sp. 54 TaxID=2035212 RepID=UPI000C192652|nr:hypothetical protein [Variovorax sp. 54]
MHQISFSAFAKRHAERDADFLDCAPSAVQTEEVKAMAAPASSGSRACSLRDRRIEAVSRAAVRRWGAAGFVGSCDRWAVVAHCDEGPRVYKFAGRPKPAMVIEGHLVETLVRLQVAA